jgi:hypothetical protein
MTNPQNDRTGALEVPPMSSEEAAHIVENDDALAAAGAPGDDAPTDDDARTSDTAHTGETQGD